MSNFQSQTWSASPNPDWKPGQTLAENKTESGKAWRDGVNQFDFKTLDLEAMEPQLVYKLMTSGIVPRPIAFVSTRSEQGDLNLAPFSFFQMLVNDPPLVMICPGTLRDPQTHDKNTTANIKETKEFTINVVSDAFAEAMNWSSVDMPLSEWLGSGLTPLESELVKPPRVKEAAVTFECHLHSFTDFESAKRSGERSSTLIIGLIKRMHIRHDVLNGKEDAIDPFKLRPVIRMGSGGYGKFGEGYQLARPNWKECKEEINKLYTESNGQ